MKCSFRKDLFSVSIAVVVSVVTQRFRDDPNTRLWKQHTTACFTGTSPSLMTWYSRGFRSWRSSKMKGFKRSYRDCLYYGSLGRKSSRCFRAWNTLFQMFYAHSENHVEIFNRKERFLCLKGHSDCKYPWVIFFYLLPPQGFGPEAKTRGGIIVVRA